MKPAPAFLLPSVLIAFLSPTANADFETPLLITHAKIVTSPDQTIDDGAILINHGRIVAVGADVAAPPDAEKIDLGGLIVYPGFIDAASHAGITQNEPEPAEETRFEDEMPDVVQGPQSATVQAYRRLVHPHWRAAELFDPKAAKNDDARAAGFTTALITPKPAVFSGVGAVIELGDGPLRRMIVLPDFAQGAAFVTGRTRGEGRPEGRRQAMEEPRYPTTTMGAMALFRQVMLDSQWQRDLLAWSLRHPMDDRPPVDRDLEAILQISDGRLPVAFFADLENEIHRALDMAAEFHLKPIIIGAREGWKVAERLKKENVPVILSLKWSQDPSKRQNAKTPKRQNEGKAASQPADSQPAPLPDDLRPIFDEEWEKQPFEPQRLVDERVRLWHEEIDNAKKLHEAGVAFAIGTYDLKSPGELWKRLRKAVKRGLPESVAVAGLTCNAAAVLGLSNSLGSIAPVRLANLTIFDKPISDKNAKVRLVFVEGKRYDIDTSAKRDREKGKDQEKDEPDEDEEPAASQPSSGPASQPTTQPAKPVFRCETEADRRPALHTGGNLLIKRATLLTLASGDLPETDLLIKDGKIAEIGKNLLAPPGVTTLDLHGYFVSPGIIDPHSHICSDGGLNEFSLSVTPEVRVRDVINHMDVSAYRALAGGVTTVHTMHGSANTIGGQNAVLHLKYGRPAGEWPFKGAPQNVKFALGENVKQSNFGNKGTRFPNTRMGVEAVLRRSFDAARKYKADWTAYEKDKAAAKDPKPVRRDLRLEALAAIHDGAIWVHSHCYRADEILRLLAVAEDYGFRIAVLQHVLEGYRIIPEIRRHGCGASTFSDWWAYKIEAFDAIPQNAARMIQGGVVATVNSDSAEVGRHLNLEAAKSLHFGGLAPNDALRLCTLNGAIQLGIDKYVGSIEKGKLADLAIFSGHPLDTFSRCVLTLVEGEAYFQHECFEADKPFAPLPPKTFAPTRPLLDIKPSPSRNYRITGATIHPVSGPAIENGYIDVLAGMIGPMGKAEGSKPPADAIVIDAAGLHVYPGLINAASQLGLIEIGSIAGTVDTAEIGSFQPDISSLSAYNPFSASVGVARSEGITSALLIPAGGPVGGRAGLVHLAGWSMPEATVAQSLALSVALPSLPLRFPDEMPEDKQKEAKDAHNKNLAEIEAFFRKARHYADVAALPADPSRPAPEYDRRLDAMIPFMQGKAPVVFDASSFKQIKEAVAFAERYKLRPVLSGATEAWKLADELAEKKVDVILERPTDYPSDKFEPWDSVYSAAWALHRAGVRFAIAVRSADLAKQIGVEAGLAVANGLDADEAIKSITLAPAQIIGVADRLGSLEAGKTADLIITTDSPLQASCAVVAEFIGGVPVDLANKHTRTDDQFRARPAPKLPPPPELRGPPPIRLPIAGAQ